MFRKTTIIKGLTILLTIGVLVTLGWTGSKIIEKETKQSQIEIQKEAKEITESTNITDKKNQGIETLLEPKKEKQITNQKYITFKTADKILTLPAPKEGPPYKIGDIIGYSQEELPEVYVSEIVVAAEWGSKIIKEKPKVTHPDPTYDTFELLYFPEKPNEIGKKERWETLLPVHFQRLNIDIEKWKKEGLIKEINEKLYWRVALLGSPLDVILNREGNIFIIDEISNQIKEYTPEGTFVYAYSLSILPQINPLREAQLQNWRKDIVFEVKDSEEKIIKIKNLKKKLKNVPKDEIVIKVQPSGVIHGTPRFVGIDHSNNLYFIIPIYKQEYELHKYNLDDGKLLARLSLGEKPRVKMEHPPIYVNEKGEIYQLLILDKCYIVRKGLLK